MADTSKPVDRTTHSAPTSTKRDFLVGGALVMTAAVTGLFTAGSPRASPRFDRSLNELVPRRIGPWVHSSSEGLVIPEGEPTTDEPYDEVLTRHYYQGSAPPIMLLIAYGNAQKGNAQLHRPEVCYPGAGFKVQRWRDIELTFDNTIEVAARLLTAKAPARIEQILYWSRVGDEFPTDSLAQRWAVLRRIALGTIPDGVLVRISTINPERRSAVEVLTAFATALVASADPDMRRMLLGASQA